MSVRLNINVNDETAAVLRETAEREGTTVTEMVRRVVSVYKFFLDAEGDGDVIRLVDDDGTTTRVVLL